MSVRPSVCVSALNKSSDAGRVSMNCVLSRLSRYAENIQHLLESEKIIGTLHKDLCTVNV